MKTYNLEVKDVDDFIPELAEVFGIGYKNELGEHHLQIPDEIGKGEITGINFPNGIGFYTYHLNLSTDLELEIHHPEIKPIRFLYCLEGSLVSHFKNPEEKVSLRDHQHLIAAPLSGESHTLIFEKDTDIAICYLEIDRLRFQNYLSFNLNEVEPVFYKIFSDVEAKNRISKVGKFSLRTSDIIKEIKNCDITGFPRVNFIGAKALEILSYMLSRFRHSEKDFYNKNLREKDLNAIEKAVQHINENIASAGTVYDLAQMAGVNTNKLQEGFQAVYGKTVNEYIRDIRLTKALNMLSSGNKNVSEVVYELGLSSRSYFSKIFKNKYGVSPRTILAQNSVPIEED